MASRGDLKIKKTWMVTHFQNIWDEAHDDDSCAPAPGNLRPTPLDALETQMTPHRVPQEVTSDG